MPTLYHTDTSYYSQIVRLVLEEEGVQYKSRHFDIHSSMEQLNSWYLNINPNGVVPTLIYQGKPIVESRDISLFVVEEISNEGRLLLKQTKVRRILQMFFKSTSVLIQKKKDPGQTVILMFFLACALPDPDTRNTRNTRNTMIFVLLNSHAFLSLRNTRS